ncbi:hypothetical protein ABPG77_002562 [Micractinium sp. CCAP 211/92]
MRSIRKLLGRDTVQPAEENDRMTEEEAQQQPQDGDRWDAEAIEKMVPRRDFPAYTGWASQGPSDAALLASVGSSIRALGAAPPAPMPLFAAAGRPRMAAGRGAPGGAPRPAMAMAAQKMAAPMAAAACAIGFKTGGAQDAANFRENIKQGHLPAPSDVTYEGLIKDYMFDTSPDTGPAEPCTELFCPAYSLALAPDPLLAASAAAHEKAPPPQDVFLAVGLDSGITDFRRPRLNLVVLLDISGSMACPFNSYYYDAATGRQRQLTGADARRTKLDVAKDVIKGMLARLGPDDSVAITLFNNGAATPKRMGRWGSADAAGIRAGVDSLYANGGTNFQVGLDEAASQLRGHPDCIDGDPATTENRIIVLTDAETNCGDITEEGLLARLKAAAADRFYTTIVGVGLDFNSQLVDGIMKVRGANYFSVHSPGEFKQRLDDEFDFMVAPLVFDLELRVDPASLDAQEPPAAAAAGPEAREQRSAAAGVPPGGGWKVVHVYGSPDSEERRLSGGGSIMRIHTLFPSAKTEEGIKGGVVLLRVQPPPGCTPATAPPLRLAARYCDRAGKQYNTVREVQVPAGAGDAAPGASFFQSSGVRKAVVLARLVDALQAWLEDEWAAPGPAANSSDTWQAGEAAALAGGAPRPATPAQAPAHAAAPAGPRRLRPGCPLRPLGADLAGSPPPSAAAPRRALGPWERASRKLSVNLEARAALAQLLPYVEGEVAALSDQDMRQEVDLLRLLAGQ